MSTTSLSNSWLSNVRAQHAAALDDLLRIVVLGDGSPWTEFSKITHAIDYEGIYDMTLEETGPKASKDGRVEWIQKYFLKEKDRQNRFRNDDTAGVPPALFNEMISAWKLRARDGGWTTAEILKSRSGKYTNNLLARSACGIQIRKDGHPLKGLNYIVLQLDPDCMLSEYVEADLDPARLLQVHEFGDWYLVLGPGCCIRKACLHCWNIRAEFIAGTPAFSSPALLCGDTVEGEELFIHAEDRTIPCSNPYHDENVAKTKKKRVGSGHLVMTIGTPDLVSLFPTSEGMSRSPSKSPPKAFPTTLNPTIMEEDEHFFDSAPSPPSPDIRKPPPCLRAKVINKRKLNQAINHAQIALGVQRLTKRLRSEAYDSRLHVQQVDLELKKSKTENRLSEEKRILTKKALGDAMAIIKDKNISLAQAEQQARVERESAILNIEEKEKEIVTLKKEMKDMEAGMTELKQAMKNMEAVIMKLKQTTKDVEAERERLKKLGEKEEQRTADFQAQITKLEEDLKLAQKEKEAHLAKPQSLDQAVDLAAAKVRILTLEALEGTLRKDISQLSQRNRDMKAYYESQLNARLEKMETTHRKQAGQHIVDTNSVIASHRVRINELEGQLQAEKAKGGHHDYLALSAQLVQANERIAQLQRELGEAYKDYGKLQMTVNRLQAPGNHGMGVQVGIPVQPLHAGQNLHGRRAPSVNIHPVATNITAATPPATASPSGSHRSPSPPRGPFWATAPAK